MGGGFINHNPDPILGHGGGWQKGEKIGRHGWIQIFAPGGGKGGGDRTKKVTIKRHFMWARKYSNFFLKNGIFKAFLRIFI